MVSNYGLKPQNSKIVRGTYIRRQTSLQNSESSNTEKMPNQKMLHRRKIITPVESLLLPTVSSTTSSSSGFHSDSLKHTNSSHSDNSSDSPTENFQVGSFFKSDSRRNSNFSHARLRTISYDVFGEFDIMRMSFGNFFSSFVHELYKVAKYIFSE